MARIGRVIEDRDAQLLTVHLTEVIHPACAMTPDLRFAAPALGIHHQARALGNCQRLASGFLKRRRQTDGEGTFLGIAESDFCDRGENDVEIDHAPGWLGIERHDARFRQQSFSLGIHPVKSRVNRTRLFSAGETADAIQHDVSVFPTVLGRLVAPEIVTVDTAMAEPKAAMVRVVVSLTLHTFHWITARYYLA